MSGLFLVRKVAGDDITVQRFVDERIYRDLHADYFLGAFTRVDLPPQ